MSPFNVKFITQLIGTTCFDTYLIFFFKLLSDQEVEEVQGEAPTQEDSEESDPSLLPLLGIVTPHETKLIAQLKVQLIYILTCFFLLTINRTRRSKRHNKNLH